MGIELFTTFLSTFTLFFVTYNLKIINFTWFNFFKNLVIVCILAGGISLKSEMLFIPVFLISMMILLYIENGKIIINLLSVIFSIIIIVLSDAIQGVFLIKILNQDIHSIISNPVTYVGMHILLFFIAFLLSSIVAFVLKKFKFNIEVITLKNKFALFTLINFLTIASIFYINAMLMKFSHINNFITDINSALLLSYFFSTMIITYAFAMSLKKEIEFENKKNEMENLKEYTSNLEGMYNDMRKFRHDYINILSSMTEYIEQKDLEGLEKFFNKKILLLHENISKKNYKLGVLQNIKITELKGILSSKVIRAQELGIDVFIDIMEPVEFINMDIIDLCRSIGILLDNAIEAAMLCKTPSVKIGIINKKNSTVILVINSCGQTPPIYKMFESGFSTKGTNRGLGLSNLKEILSNYMNISLDTSIENEEFIQNMEVVNSY